MASLKQELLDTFQDIINQRDQLRRELVHAQEIINLLETEIIAAKYHGDEAFAQVADQLGVARHKFQDSFDPPPASYWLDDLWLSVKDNANLLADAEEAWSQNIRNPQKALDIASAALKDNKKRDERVKCNLFISAIMLSSGNTELASASANEALRECRNDFQYKHLAGIGHFLRGRTFLEINLFRLAYWDLSLALSTPGYHDRAKYFQQYTENRILQEEQYGIPLRAAKESIETLSPTSPLERKPVLRLVPETQIPMQGFQFERVITAPT